MSKSKTLKPFNAQVEQVVDVEEEEFVTQGIVEEDAISNIKTKSPELAPVDLLDSSIEKQVTQLGRATAEALRKSPKDKVLIPIDKLNKDDKFVVVGINGWNFQIQRNVPVILPEEVIDLLIEGGYTPTRVR